MTDQDVIDLYRCLLARDPEDSGTIAAFRAYYPTIERGRRAILMSDEFATVFARDTGRIANGADHVAAALALAFLERATAAAATPLPQGGPDDILNNGMAQHFGPEHPERAGAASADPARLAPACLAIVVGQNPILRLDDLVPLGGPEAAILHVAPGFPPVIPLTATLADGTAVFRLNGDPDGIAAFLANQGRRLDALILLDRFAGPHWVDRLRAHFAARTLVAIGPAQDGFDPQALSAAIAAGHHSEPVLTWHGLLLHHVGGWLLPVTYAPPQAMPPPPDRAAFPSLAIAAIVRDEAVCIRNMLASTRPVASFYAVLDTGSEDATPALAQDYLAACGVPFAFAERNHAAFDDDFGAMRNAALAMVPDWIDWVLMLDADEELVQEDHPALLQLLADAARNAPSDNEGKGPDAFALPRYNFAGAGKASNMLLYPDRQVRLLRNTPDHRVRYAGVVHETVSGTGHVSLPLDAAIIGGPRGGPHIHHLVRRFRTPEQEDRKQEWYREIARRRLEGGGEAS